MAVLFTVLQMGRFTPMHSLMALAIAFFYGWIVQRTKSIVGTSISHGLFNVGLYLVFPLLLELE